LTPELAEDLSRAEHAIFIDAAATGEPGAIHRKALLPESDAAAFTHRATPAALLAAALALYGRAPDAVLYSVPVETTELGDRLTPSVGRALEQLVAEISSRFR